MSQASDTSAESKVCLCLQDQYGSESTLSQLALLWIHSQQESTALLPSLDLRPGPVLRGLLALRLLLGNLVGKGKSPSIGSEFRQGGDCGGERERDTG